MSFEFFPSSAVVQKCIIPDILKYVVTIGRNGQVLELCVSAPVVYSPMGTFGYDVALAASIWG